MSTSTNINIFWGKINSHTLFPLILSGMIGVLFGVSLYGTQILDPVNTGWLYANGDISQHQIGWDFFRQDLWRMPLGSIHNLAYPEGTSLVYMDSIPVAAVFAKLFSSILPDQFQYFGIWGAMSFFLQGAIAALVLRRYSKNNSHIILGSILIVLLPIFLMRTYAHTALASQWVILIGIALVVYRHKLNSLPKGVAIWSVLMSLSVAIHPYFLPMNSILLLVFLVLQRISISKSLLYLGVAGVSSIGIFWLMGGFVTKDVGTTTLGMFGADFNALVNPINFSYFINALPTTVGGYEGLAYMGLGVYLLLVIITARYLMTIKSLSQAYQNIQNVILRYRRYMVVIAIVLGSVLLAIGPVWYLNGNQIAIFDLPDWLARALSIFRSTGRFMWIASYAISLLAIVWILRQAATKKASVIGVTMLLLLVVTVQYVDVARSNGMRQKVTTIKSRSQSQNRFDTPEVYGLISGKKHVAYVTNTLHDIDFFELGPIIARSGLTINDGYISRKPVDSVNRETRVAFQELTSGSLKDDTVYVTNEHSDTIMTQDKPEFSIVRIDKTWLVTKR